MNPHFVRFVGIVPDHPHHPLLSYLAATYSGRTSDIQLNTTVYVGRVSINADGSYVSIDLSDLSRLGYIIKSVEILDDSSLATIFQSIDMIYSSVYHSFFHELIIVWNKASRAKGVPFSVSCIITANTVRVVML